MIWQPQNYVGNWGKFSLNKHLLGAAGYPVCEISFTLSPQSRKKPPNTVNKLTREKDIRQTCKSSLVEHLSAGLSLELAVDGARQKDTRPCTQRHKQKHKFTEVHT